MTATRTASVGPASVGGFCQLEDEWAVCLEFAEGCWTEDWLCMPDCHPAQGNCSPDTGCHWTGIYTWVCLPDRGESIHGEACEEERDCAGNHACLPGEAVPDCESDSCCSRGCEAWDNFGCEDLPGTYCNLLVPDPWCEGDLGVCVAPDWGRLLARAIQRHAKRQ